VKVQKFASGLGKPGNQLCKNPGKVYHKQKAGDKDVKQVFVMQVFGPTEG